MHWKHKRPLPAHLFSQGHVQQQSQRGAMLTALCYDEGSSLLDISEVVASGVPDGGLVPLLLCLHLVTSICRPLYIYRDGQASQVVLLPPFGLVYVGDSGLLRRAGSLVD